MMSNRKMRRAAKQGRITFEDGHGNQLSPEEAHRRLEQRRPEGRPAGARDEQRRSNRAGVGRARSSLDELAEAVDLVDAADRDLHKAVRACRIEGRSWREIAAVLGVSAQAAHKRFR